MWASILHLIIGNAIIGLFEGLLLSWMYKVPRWQTVTVLVAANYASAWTGGVWIIGSVKGIPDITIENVRLWFWLLVVAAFAVTLIIEFPFIWYALRSKQRPVMTALKAVVVIHSISYIVIFGWYWNAGEGSLMTELAIVAPRDIVPATGYNLYYLTSDGSQVIESDLFGNAPRVIKVISAKNSDSRLYARKDAQGKYDLYVHAAAREREKERNEIVKSDFSDQAPLDWRHSKENSDDAGGTWFNFGSVPSLARVTDWKYHTGFWPAEGISGENEKLKLHFRFSMETPYVAWIARNATHLEGDSVVLQIGDDQICILDPLKKRIALIARGHGCIVAKQKTKGISSHSGKQ